MRQVTTGRTCEVHLCHRCGMPCNCWASEWDGDACALCRECWNEIEDAEPIDEPDANQPQGE